MSEETIADLMSFTGLGHEEATTLLQAAGGSLEAAATLHFEQQDGRAAASAAEAAAVDSDEDDGFELLDGAPPENGVEGFEAAAAEPPDAVAGERLGGYPRLSYVCGLLWRVPGIPMVSALAMRLGSLLYSFGLSGFYSLLLAPLSLLGLLPDQPRVPPGAPAVRRLESIFETDYGTTHPAFFRGTCQQALQRSRQQARFVLVCLYTPGDPETAEFCRRVLSSPLFTAFVDENFICWMGDTGCATQS